MSASTKRSGRIACAATLGVLAGSMGAFGVTPPLIAFAEPAVQPQSVEDGIFEEAGLQYIKNDDGTATIVGLADDSIQDVVVPETIGGLAVTAIGSAAFYESPVQTVELPDSVQTIGSDAFRSSSLRAIDLPAGLKSIGTAAFEYCSGLQSIEIPDEVTRIERVTFFCCYNLESVKLPKNLDYIGQQAFSDCTSLVSVVVPDKTTIIGMSAFEDCTSLMTVKLPASVESVLSAAFNNIGLGSTITVQTSELLNELEDGDNVNLDRTTVVFEEGYPVAVASVTLDRTELTLNLSANTQLTATVTPNNADGEVTWTSSNPSVATVSSNGRVTARAIGTTQIIATAGDKSAVCNVTVAKIENRTIGQFDGEQTASASMKSGAEDRWAVDNPAILSITGVSSVDASFIGKTSTAKFVPKEAGTTILRCYADNVLVYALVVTVMPGQKTSISGATISGLEESYELSDDPVTPKPTVTLNGTTLAEGTDYTLSYKDNDKAGTATVIVTGAGKYEGTVQATFKIVEVQNDLKDSTIAGIDAQYEWEGKAIEPKPTVTLGGKTLKEGTDYTLSYTGNAAVGTATLTVTGKGDYKGSRSAQFKIVDEVRDLANAVISGIEEKYEYEGKAIEPKPTVTVDGKALTEGTDYTLAYKNNNAIGTATITITAKGDYKGTKTLTFEIVDEVRDLKDAVITGLQESYVYEGSPIEPKPTVTLGGKTLKEGTDYTLSYSDNDAVGTATIIITSAGDYQGICTVTFKIVEKQVEIEFTDVAPEAWYHDPVYAAAANGYMNGYAGTTLFGPENNITRGQVACVLYNMANGELGAQSYSGYSFPDVNQSEYYADAIAWAKASGVVNGYGDGTFRPEAYVSAEEFAAMLANYAQLSGRYSTVDTDAILAQFGDGGQVSDWARNVVAWAVSEHVIGNGGFLDPTGAVARGRVAAMAVNFQPEAL